MEIDILDKFSTNLKDVLTRALEAAILNNQKNVNPINLLNSLAKQKGSIAHEVIKKINFKPREIKKNISSEKPGDTATKIKNPTPVLSPDAKRAIEKAVLAANLFSHKYVGTEHLLFSLLEIRDKAILQELHEQKIDLNKLKNQTENILKTTSKFSEITEQEESILTGSAPVEPIGPEPIDPGSMFGTQTQIKDKSKTPALDFFSVDLTSPEVQRKIDPLIGRGDELLRLMQVLCRRHKNNPLLLGEPGVGKTAIVEGLAKKIISGEVPDELTNKKILALDLSLIIAGTMYRGEFEARLKQIIEEIRNNKNLIVFIDEVHNIIGAGSTAGSLDAANILKPALARGELHCIGATTLEEFKKHIESDPALERRFQAIIVKEPAQKETLEILKGIRPNYEKFHKIKITDPALEAAVELSVRYLTDKFLPDKAIDLIDEAASGIKIATPTDPHVNTLRQLENDLKTTQEIKQRAVLDERYSEAVDLKVKEKNIEQKIIELQKKLKMADINYGILKSKDVLEVISRQIGVPIHELEQKQGKKFLNIADRLSKSIIGQDYVIDELVKTLSRAKTGFNDPARPLASFLFIGPSGVGKTELAKVLARELYPQEDALIQIDMSEFKETYSASKLLGSPAGYVGYKERNKFTDEVRKKPYAVVLFDEFEKAHPDVQSLLLQILDQGTITDATGRKINFKNAVIILTSNLGQDILNQQIGFSSDSSRRPDFAEFKKSLELKLKNTLRPELINRLDNVLCFNPMNKDSLEKIIKNNLKKIAQNAQKSGLDIKFSTNVIGAIVKKCLDSGEGARAVRKTLLNLVENPLSEMILNGKINKGDALKISFNKGKFTFN